MILDLDTGRVREEYESDILWLMIETPTHTLSVEKWGKRIYRRVWSKLLKVQTEMTEIGCLDEDRFHKIINAKTEHNEV